MKCMIKGCNGKLDFVEDIIAYRKVEGFDADGVLIISGSVDDYSEGDNERLVCQACGEVFDLPEKVDYR